MEESVSPPEEKNSSKRENRRVQSAVKTLQMMLPW
jgi:hypothetical protein